MADASARRDPAAYIQAVSKHALQAGITNEHAQCTWAWNHLDVELQTTVSPPTASTTLRAFTEKLDTRKEMFFRIVSTFEDRRKEAFKRENKEKKDTDRAVKDKVKEHVSERQGLS